MIIFFVAFQVFTFDNVFPSDVKQVLSDFLDNHNYNRLVNRVFLKIKNPFLWAGLWNPIVSIYGEPKYQFSEFLDTYWPLAP